MDIEGYDREDGIIASPPSPPLLVLPGPKRDRQAQAKTEKQINGAIQMQDSPLLGSPRVSLLQLLLHIDDCSCSSHLDRAQLTRAPTNNNQDPAVGWPCLPLILLGCSSL